MKKIILLFLAIFALHGQEDDTTGYQALEGIFKTITTEAFFNEFDNEKNKTALNSADITELKEDLEQMKKSIVVMVQEIDKNRQDILINQNPQNSKIEPQTKGSIIDNSQKAEPQNRGNQNFQNEQQFKSEIETINQKIELLGQGLKKLNIFIAELAQMSENTQNTQNSEIKENTQKETNYSYTIQSNLKSGDKLRLYTNSAPIKNAPFSDAQTVKTLPRDTVVAIQSCDRYGWCKLLDEDGYIQKYLFLKAD